MKYNKIYKTRKQSSIKKTSTKKRINNHKTITILSYNISWESMSGKVSDWKLCSNNVDKDNPKHYSVCVNNIANVINNTNSLDFITLQEATDFEKLIEQSPLLKKMNYELHTSGLDKIVTFWKPNYKLLHTIKGEFEKGRPWLTTFLQDDTKKTLCLINIHMGHYKKEIELLKLKIMLQDIKNTIAEEEIGIKLNTIRYIISGDFNYNIKEFGNSQHKIIINETTFYHHPKHILTCCINRKKHNDHVIDSYKKPIHIHIPNVNYMASDHKPIIVELVK